MGIIKFLVPTFLCFFFVNASLYCDNENSCDMCNDQHLNITNDQVLPRFKSLVPRIWSQNIPLTSLGRRLRILLLNLTETGNQESSFLSIVTSIFFNNFYPYLDQEPDACMMAAMINGTVSCVNTNDDSKLQTALNAFKTSLHDINYYDMRTMILSAGCDFRCGKIPPDPKFNKTICYENGFVYQIEALWNIPGAPYANIDPAFKKTVLELYKSKNFVDRFLAACATFCLSEVTQRLFNKWSPNHIIEAKELEMSDPINKNCCYSRIKRADEVRMMNDDDTERTAANEKNASYYGVIEKSCEICNDQHLNLTNDEVLPRFKSLVPRIWSQDIPLTRLGRRLKNLLLNLAETGNQDTSFLAIVTSVFFNNFYPYLDQEPDACMMAAMINGTVSCVNTNDDSQIQIALNAFQAKFYDIDYYDMRTMILSAGCDFRCGKSPPDPKLNKTICYENGFVYPIETLWNIPGAPYANIDPAFKNLVLELYKSNNFVDRFLAVCATFGLSEVTQRLFAKWNPNYIIEAKELEMSDPVKKKCCYSRIKRADEVRKMNDADADRTVTNEKAYLSVTKCKRD